MNRRPETEERLRKRIDELCQDMLKYLKAYYVTNPFHRPNQLESHLQTIQLRCKLSSVKVALHDDSFVSSLRKTLVAWGMDARGAAGKLAQLPEFGKKLREQEEEIASLEGAKIDDPNLPLEKTVAQLWRIIERMKLSEVENQIDIGSKTLHHLLPDLIPPMDRNFTRPFFWFWMQQFQNNPGEVFQYMWKQFAHIACKTNPGQYLNQGLWNTSKTKILDNAIVGYCKYHSVPKL